MLTYCWLLVQAVLEPFCIALAQTKRPALAARLQDGVFGALLERGCAGTLARLDMRALAERLFELGTVLMPPPLTTLCACSLISNMRALSAGLVELGVVLMSPLLRCSVWSHACCVLEAG